LTKFQKDLFFNQKRVKKSEKKFQKFFCNFSKEIFVHKILRNFLSPLKIENKHTEAKNQFVFKLRKSLVAFQWLYLPSGLYNLISSPIRNITRRPWTLLTQLIPEVILGPLRRAESSLNFCIHCRKSGINFNQLHESLKSMFQKILLSREIKCYHLPFFYMNSPNLKILNSSILLFESNKLLISNKGSC